MKKNRLLRTHAYHTAILIGSVVFFLFLGCQKSSHTYRFTRFSMDTVIEYTVVSSDQLTALKAVNVAHQTIVTLDSLYWEENPTSPIFQLNHATNSVVLPDSVYQFLQRVQTYWKFTHGFFDPSVKPFLDLYGFEQDSPTPPTPEKIAGVRPFVGFQHFHFQHGNRMAKDAPQNAIALGGVAKGYAVDRAVAVLQQMGIQAGIVNAGGDLRCWRADDDYWQVGIRHPRKQGLLAVLKLQNAAVATSGDYQRYYFYQNVRYHHLIDPRTGEPGRLSQSATVIAPTCETADAFATGLFIMGPRAGIAWLDSLNGIDGILVDSSGNVHTSRQIDRYLVEITK